MNCVAKRTITGLALLFALVGLSACDGKHVAWEELNADDPRICDFDVQWVDGKPAPFDSATKERLGYFERFEDPRSVALFDGVGTVRDVTGCLKNKGFESLMTVVPLYVQ
jgi:hypothetical protein